MKKGVLLINLGTPDAPTTEAVRRYLREFLSDPRVIDVNPVGRWMLLNLVILPRRPARSAEAYAKVWTAEGSPLLVNSRALEAAVRAALAGEMEVELGMRYGNPSLPFAIERLKARGVTEFTVLPLYPQQSMSATETSVVRVGELLGSFRAVPSFFSHPRFVQAWAEVAAPVIAQRRPDHLLFSFHGLPLRHMRKGNPEVCEASGRCSVPFSALNSTCYRAQSFETARLVAQALGVGADGYTVAFQSRLGATAWIQPYTDEVLPKLASSYKRVAVLCPAFVADCLETLEEIGIRAREQFRRAGGEELTLVPSLNAHPTWVQTVVELVRDGTSVRDVV